MSDPNLRGKRLISQLDHVARLFSVSFVGVGNLANQCLRGVASVNATHASVFASVQLICPSSASTTAIWVAVGLTIGAIVVVFVVCVVCSFSTRRRHDKEIADILAHAQLAELDM